MYIIHSNIAVVMITKCGTHSQTVMITHSAAEHGQIGRNIDPHISMSVLNERVGIKYNANPTFCTIIRHPFERIVSAINQVHESATGTGLHVREYKMWPEELCNLDEYINNMLTPNPNIHFRLQSSFLDMPNVPCKLFRFGEWDEFAKYIGYEGETPRMNVGQYVYSAEEVQQHRRYPDILEYLKPDFELYNQL